ncbi:MAG: helix-turn-helix transcriptional regulator [Pseudobdellovibrionaceae bacterium]|nr:MAG: helix-turn-helix transcriptional regulator [Pseudobdellovibrionaceae bacterium]
MSSETSLTVKAENYVSKFSFLDSSLIRFDRIHRFPSSITEIDVLPGLWSIAIGSPDPGQLSVSTEDGPFAIVGPHMVFIPPFSIINWDVSPGLFEFTALIGLSDLPSDVPKVPFIAIHETGLIPESTEEAIQLVRSKSERIFIRQQQSVSVVAQKMKIFIDENYHKRLSIAEIAKKLGYSHSFLSRTFKASYGLSINEYRTKLRLFDAQFLLLSKSPQVASAGFASGFSDQGRFHKQFRRLFHARPSQFRPEK